MIRSAHGIYRYGGLQVASVWWRCSGDMLLMMRVTRDWRVVLAAVVATQTLLPFEALTAVRALQRQEKERETTMTGKACEGESE